MKIFKEKLKKKYLALFKVCDFILFYPNLSKNFRKISTLIQILIFFSKRDCTLNQNRKVYVVELIKLEQESYSLKTQLHLNEKFYNSWRSQMFLILV